MNLFGTVLTHTAPSANYRGESAENRAVIQKITKGRHEYPIISPETMRNALRESLATTLGKDKCNRERLHDEEQLAVKFKVYPDADRYADDFFMGWLIATKDRDGEKEKLILNEFDPRGESVRKALVELNNKIKDEKDDGKKKKLKTEKDALIKKVPMSFKRDSILRMNMAVGLEPYRHNTVFTQSPQNVDSPWKNADNSQLLHRETAVTAFQYPFALNMEECRAKKDWTKALLKAIGELNNVAGNHARSYYEMSPASIVVRLTNQLVAGYDTYGFRIKEGDTYTLPEIVDGILKGDYPGSEFYLGGKVVKDMEGINARDSSEKPILKEDGKTPKTLNDVLEEKGVTIDRNPQRLLKTIAEVALG
jgi:CRISPR-associated protein Cst2